MEMGERFFFGGGQWGGERRNSALEMCRLRWHPERWIYESVVKGRVVQAGGINLEVGSPMFKALGPMEIAGSDGSWKKRKGLTTEPWDRLMEFRERRRNRQSRLAARAGKPMEGDVLDGR